ncbi:hypothetical protein AMAG_04547 [Allomyces macrogynus ATCC 38327]|uniref:mitochondrial processing peptidase n=1 Tax=Allomyces macrogynus (strain ATCC 38327) TaxID=578462 RepID=A0A0L0S595_ALLM3|nr:hypothetical protein AMAG_04547 [Allomyces macrogynus ATCC 38327]|eukprot:KNE57687.1 hypothetical protein AMAG_04547 [Allomyces macrogynus ATCC 38327]
MIRSALRLPLVGAARAAARQRAALATVSSNPLSLPATQITKLRNGLTVATETNPQLETATVGVWIDSGSRAETLKNNGVAHFLEHISFKGTQHRTQVDLELEIENMGGHLNAYTSREHTVYYARLFAQDVPRGVEILGDILQNSKLDTGAIDRERAVILREADEVDKQMEEVVFDQLHAAAFPDNSLGFTILGPRDNIRSLQRADLAEYIRTNYTADRMFIVGAGKVDHAQLCALAEQHFGTLPPGTGRPHFPTPQFTGADVRLREDNMRTAHVAIAVRGCGWRSKDHWPLLVASSMIGSWDRAAGNAFPSSSLARYVAGQADLANSFLSFNTTYSDMGLWGTYLTSDNREKLSDLVRVTLREWARLATDPTVEEVEQAKLQLKTSLLLALDGTSPVAEEIGRQMLVFGTRHSIAEIAAQVDAVTIDDVVRVAREYVFDRDLAIVSVGPIEAVPQYDEIRSAARSLGL